MKISSAISFMVIIAGIFFVFSLMIEESNTEYPDADLDSSEWEAQYDYIEDINRATFNLTADLALVAQEDTGWFKKITTGITAIPKVIVGTPIIMFHTFVFAGNIVTDFLLALKLSGKIILVATTLISLWLIFKLLEFISNRNKV